jgi:shikimate dehydrogenase
MTQQYGILAFPAKHSLSPVVFDAAFKAIDTDSQFGFFEIPENELGDFMDRMKAGKVSGLSVSLPYKEMILNYMDQVSEDAKKIGAVNTVVNRDGVFYGYNTDFVGSSQALKEAVGDLKNKQVVILGAGGAARAVIYGLLKEGANVLGILNRTLDHAEKLAKEFSEMFGVEIKAFSSENLANTLSFQKELIQAETILIQTTSLWTLQPDITAAESEKFCPAEYVKYFSTVMEIVYKPLFTPLLKTARALGKKIITGDKMFLYQASEQFKLFTGKEAPMEVMRKTLNENLSQ